MVRKTRHVIKKGLSLPIAGAADATRIEPGAAPRTVAVLAADYHGMKPTMHVAAGDTVGRGQLLFEDKKTPGVRYTSPAAGTVSGVHRGERRALISVTVELSESERTTGRPGDGEAVTFASHAGVARVDPLALERQAVRDLLLESGLWTALRARPFGCVADPAVTPAAVFVNLMDTAPLALDPNAVLRTTSERNALKIGICALRSLTDGPTYVCKGPDTDLASLQLLSIERIEIHTFDGPHPAGTVGLHIHTLDPVGAAKTVWHAGLQDVVAIGKLILDGELTVERLVSLAGPQVKEPRILRTRLGASIDDLVAGQLNDGENRVVSGSALSGRPASGEQRGFLGRYDTQITALREGRERELMGWLAPGARKFSILPMFLSKLLGGTFAMTTTTHGSHRPILPIGVYEQVMPMDILATFLLRALAMHDVERAEELGALELEEEDLALCTFVCPGKNDHGTTLRETLDMIQKEG